MFKKDTYLAGILAGIIFPVLCFGILYALKILAVQFFSSAQNFTQIKMMFAAAALNVLPIRYFFISREMPKTAQGTLLITVVMIVTIVLSF
jgi:hypothetical protein